MLGNMINAQISPGTAFAGSGGGRSYTVCKGAATDEYALRSPGSLLIFDENGELTGKHTVRVRIVAVAESADRVTYICAPDGVMLFAPVIREVLESRRPFAPLRLTCLYEKSCGAVIFRRHSGNVEYLLVKNKKGNNWGFPKGHMEMHETERQTATREVREETGLNVRLLDGFRTISEYHPKGRIVKQVIFFVAEMPDEEVVIQPSEIERFIWADYSLALKTFKFSNDKKVLTQAKSWLMERRY